MKHVVVLMALLVGSMGALGVASAREMIDYFLPTPTVSPLTSDAWGDPNVRPRDTSNGLESVDNEFHYWDGKILKTPDGKYHLHASRWPKRSGFNQWSTSIAIHAVSDQLLGPYADQGQIYDRNGGRGHNVSSLALPGGGFAVYTSDVTPGDFYTAPSIDGPWTFQGSININRNGYDIRWPISNISVIVRPDDTFLATQRSGFIYDGGTDLLGPYDVTGPSVWPNVPGLDNARAEDPVLWYSGGHYHITVNWWDSRVARHLMSKDGINDWKDMGVAYDPRSDFIRYTDGTVNHWHNLERPGVVMEDGHVVAFTFAATDVDKSSEMGNDNHGSKIIVVPFDGVAFDADFGDVPATGGGGGASGAAGASSGGAGAAGRGGAGGTNGGSGSGAAGAGGSAPNGGASAAGGNSTGGVSSSSGGSTAAGAASGGAAGSGGLGASGGSITTGGATPSSPAGSGGRTGSAGESSGSDGCSYRFPAAGQPRGLLTPVLGSLLGLLALARRRASRSARTSLR